MAKIGELNKNLRMKNEGNGTTADKCVKHYALDDGSCMVSSGDSEAPKSFSQVLNGLSNEIKNKRIEYLRSARQRNSIAPNIKARLWAVRLMDRVEGLETINLPGNVKMKRPVSLMKLRSVQGQSGATLRHPSEVHSTSESQSQSRATLMDPGEHPTSQGQTRATLSDPRLGLLTHVSGGTRTSLRDYDEVMVKDVSGGTRTTLRDLKGWVGTILQMSDAQCDPVPTQNDDLDKYTIVDNDVEALFPSLKDLESARIVREAVERSDMVFENVDITAALQYLRVCGGNDHINEIGFGSIAPRWLGKRSDLLTVGGEPSKWSSKCRPRA